MPVTETDFAYDGLGRMRQRTEWTYNYTYDELQVASVTEYIYDGNRVIQVRDMNNTPTVSYTRGSDLSGSLEGAGGIGGLLARSDNYSSGNWTRHNYYHADGNGNITYLVNSSQTLAASYRYDPYGNLISSSGTLAGANVYRSSSKEYINSVGLYFYLNRFYDPSLQRFLNQDPAGENGGIDIYQFNRNNPIDYIDPTGRAPQLTSVTYNPSTGQSSVQYTPHQFGQGYGIGLHTPPGSPLDMLTAYNDWQNEQNQKGAQQIADWFGKGNDPQAVADIYDQEPLLNMVLSV